MLLMVPLLLIQLMMLTFGSTFAQSTQTDTPAQSNSQAQNTGASTAISGKGASGSVDVSFQRLGKKMLELRAPRDVEEFELSLPYRWQITGTDSDNFLELTYNLNLDGVKQSLDAISIALDVYVNNALIKSLILEKGDEQTVRVPLPAKAFNTPSGNKHQVRLELSADYPCDEIGELRLFVSDQSFFKLKYETLPPDLDLASLPRPLFQELLSREKAIIIVPDDYSAADLAVAASVAATIGQKTFTAVDLDILRASDATPEKLADASAIVVGRPDQNSFLADLYSRDLLPTTLTKTRTIVDPNGDEVAINKGVVQLMQSEQNSNYVYLIVTGGSDEGVALAARAISATRAALRLGFDTDWAVVEQFAEADPEQTENTEVFSFGQLGFRGATLYGLGTQSANMEFFVPSNWRLTDDPVLSIPYIPSSALVSGNSGLTVLLNNQPIGTVTLDGANSGTQEMQIRLPQDEVRLGEQNRLRFEVNMAVGVSCVSPDTRTAWTRIRSNGFLQLKHTEATSDTKAVPISNPVTPLISRADLSDIWFALPQAPLPEELTGLVRVAALLGRISGGPGFMPHVSLGDVTQDELTDFSVILIGQPLRNPVIPLINDSLPQQFISGENSLRQRVGSTDFRLTESFSMGVLQTIHSPWNAQKYITAISGSTLEGVNWVVDALLDDELYYTLNGDLAYIRGRQVEALSIERLSPDVSSITAIPTAVAQLVISSSVPTSPAVTAEFVIVPTPVEPTPVMGPLPDRYKPLTQAIPYNLQVTVWSLIGVGGLALLIGMIFGSRRQ